MMDYMMLNLIKTGIRQQSTELHAVLLFSPPRPHGLRRALECKRDANLDCMEFTAPPSISTFSKLVVGNSYTVRREGQKSMAGAK